MHDPFKELGLEHGGDTRAVRAAYARLVRDIRPEDDPERFQRLREARDEALRRIAAAGGGETRTPPAVAPRAVAPRAVAPPANAPPEPADGPVDGPASDGTARAKGPAPLHPPPPGGAAEAPGEGAEDAAESAAGWFAHWDWAANAAVAPSTAEPGFPDGGDDPSPLGLDALGGATPESAALPPLTRFTLACAYLAEDAIGPNGWRDVLVALDALPLGDRIAMREPIATQILLGDALRELAARETSGGAPVPVETARLVAAIAGELDWTRTGGLFDHLGPGEGAALLRLVERRASDREGGAVRDGFERTARGLPTASDAALRPWLEPRAERYLHALERARARGGWSRRPLPRALLGGLFWAARRRCVSAYPWMIGALIAGGLALQIATEWGGAWGFGGSPAAEWGAIIGYWLLANLWPAMNAERWVVEDAARRASDPRAKPEPARSIGSAFVMGWFGVQGCLGLGILLYETGKAMLG